LNERLEEITQFILPKGCSFFPQQKAAIMAEGSLNIVAGPGSGKTTVLIAKCALLLTRQRGMDRGVCLITHTNVAVDEIKMRLKKVGIHDVVYPNFLGTIQEFFNTYFGRKAFYLIHKEKQFRVLDDEEYKNKFDTLFEKKKPDWYTYSPPNISKGSPGLVINDDYSYSIISQANESYRSIFNECINILFNYGIVNNRQCLELSKWYIEKYQEKVISAIQCRFEYLLLDEAQDTSEIQYSLLKKLFTSTKINFQKFGDPYQSLYSIFDGNRDAWKPNEELVNNGLPYEEISETSRFGSSISNLVKNVCIESYDTFESMNLVESFAPHYIIYDSKSESDLFHKYKSLIRHCTMVSKDYSISQKKDAVLSAFHDDLTSIHSPYIKPTIKIRKPKSIVRRSYDLLTDLLAKELDISLEDFINMIEDELNYKEILSKCVKEINSESFIIDDVILNLEKIIKKITSNPEACFNKINAKSQIEYLCQTIIDEKIENIIEQPFTDDKNLYIGTIHSAKGETHRSTMLVLNTVFKDNRFEPTYRMIDLLKEYLLGNYSAPDLIEDRVKRDETIKSLKLAYVALSRPTHLAVVAIPHDFISGQEEFVTHLNESGWKSLSDYHD